jgi:D-xylose 1-dehydrogenase
MEGQLRMSDAKLNADGAFATYPSLRDRAVVVTGGASGIGASIVAHFARQGARVAFLDVQDDAARELIEGLKAEGVSEPIYFRCDLCDISGLQDSAGKAIAALGGVDVLVNNAANDQRHRIEDVTPEYWDASIAVNLRPQQHHQYVVDLMDDSFHGRAGVHRGESGHCWADADAGA